MNHGIYRLVFNEVRGLWMVVDEHARSHQSGKNGARASNRRNSKSKQTSFWIVLLGITTAMLGLFADQTLAAGNLPAGTLPTGLEVKAGNINLSNPSATTLNINQSSVKGIMQGTNFNIGTGAAVNFNHTGGAGSATLIRINGPKSVIEGALNSPNGAVHLINQNGILFANGARVDVNGLVASALDVKDSDFLSDLGHFNSYLDGGRAAYVWGGDNEGFKTVLVQVEPDANIKAKLGSSVMLFAPTVVNQGSIQTTEGQVAMAAGAKVYISVAPDINSGTNVKDVYNYTKDSPYRALAGVLVEVDSYKEPAVPATESTPEIPEVDIKGQVTNDTMGRILAQRGNVTMAGFLVNQSGRVTATSSVNQKGSIRLLARDTLENNNGNIEVVKSDDSQTQTLSQRLSEIQASGNNKLITASRAGTLTIGKNSITTVLGEDKASLVKANALFSNAQAGEPAATNGEVSYKQKVINALNNYKVDDKGKVILDSKGKPMVVAPPTISDDQVYNSATIEAVGRQVNIEDNAKVVVPGGYINIAAQKNGSQFNVDNTNIFDPESRVYLGKNTLIDVAGLQNVAVSMESNFVKRLLTLTDLNDNSLNRDGFLYRKEVWFDIRNAPDSRVANLSGFISQVPRSLGEKLASAGKVDIKSEGDVIQRAGSKIDVSGGSIKYSDGVNKETWVKDASGKFYSLGNAPVDVKFTGFYGGKNSIGKRENGYVEGKIAGDLDIAAYKIALDGEVKGGAIYGPKQREADNLGGKLKINVMTPSTGELTNVNFGKTQNIEALNSLFDVGSAETNPDFRKLTESRSKTVELDSALLSKSGLESIKVKAQGNITVNSALNLADGASLNLAGNSIDINQNIVARGGKISLTSTFVETSPINNITLANGITLDVSGNWINDIKQSILPRVVTNGGSVTINSADEITLGGNSLVDVSAGGWVRLNNKVVQIADSGKAGEINIATQRGQGGNVNPYTYKAPVLDGELRGFGFGNHGGSLSITAPFITIGNAGFGDAREFLATPDFFKNNGFTNFKLTGRDGVVVRDGTNVEVTAKNYVLDKNYHLKETGSHVHDFAKITQLPEHLRSSTKLSLFTEATDVITPAEAFTKSNIARGSILIGQSASINVESNGQHVDTHGVKSAPSISLSAWDNQITVLGTLKALGGDISLTMNGDPTTESDNGYNASQAIWLGGQANLLAGGYTRTIPNRNGTREGTVYSGGNISIDAKKGYVVAQTGAVMDVSGTSATLDIKDGNRSKATVVGSNAGNISIAAREGLLLDNTFKADAPNGLAGSLDIRLSRGVSRQLGKLDAVYPGTEANINNNFTENLPNLLWYVDVAQTGQFVPTSLKAGDSIQNSAAGLAKISADRLMQGGFSEVSLNSEHGLKFTGNVDLNISRAININANIIEASPNATINLTAPNVVLGNVSNNEDANRVRPITEYATKTPLVGDAILNVNAKLIDLKGNIALSGFAKTNLKSEGDIRLTGVSDANVATGIVRPTPAGELKTTGILDFTARQIFPTTLTDYKITVEGAGGQVNFNKVVAGGDYDKVLSAAGQLTINAETINQNGVLLAPFGKINLNATNTLNLNAGSVTSVSANGSLIPFGFTDRDGQDFKYDYGPANLILNAPPERDIKLSATNLNQNENSTLDISGGGDLFAFEWVPGLGGSKDVLANGADQSMFGQFATNTWAIMPASNQTFASYDPQYWNGSNIKAGDSVYLSGVKGLAAGYYTLLPARYALLPGAMLVSAVSNQQDLTSNLNAILPNGSTLVSGHTAAYTSNGYVQTSRTSGFVVRTGQAAYKLAQYNTNSAAQFFAETVNVQQPMDAGRLSFEATNKIVLKGLIDSTPGTGGKGAEIDIAAPNLLVVADGEESGQVSLEGVSYLAINESSLNNFKAASLMLGGTRSGSNANVIASEVRLNNNANLVGPEILVAAKDKVQLDAGASVVGQGTGATAKNLTIGAENGEDGDGAFVRVSGGEYATLDRKNSDADRGDLIVKAGAEINGNGSLLLDASRKNQIDGDVNFGAGAAIGFSASRISIGQADDNATITDGFWIKKDQLDKFASADSLFLKSKSVIDVYADASFGNQNLNLNLQTAGIAGVQNAGKAATITAKNLTIANTEKVAFSEPSSLSNGTIPTLGTGELNINAQNITHGNNSVRVAGFNQTNLTATAKQVVEGNAAKEVNANTGKLEAQNQFVVDGNLTINTPHLTANKQADYVIESSNGLLKVQGIAGVSANLNNATSQASQLMLSGNQVTLANGTSLDMRGGQTSIEAKGNNATDHVTLESGSKIIAQGTTFTLQDQTVALPAGNVKLTSKNGNVDVQTNAMIDVSAAGNGNAGSLNISATNGKVLLDGDIKASVNNANNKTATVSVDAKEINNLSQAINKLSAFTGTQDYRLRQGDFNLAANENIRAQKIKVATDNGAINVNGTLDASGNKGGSVELYALNDVNVNAGAQILAKGTASTDSLAGSAGNGGDVIISSDTGNVKISAPDVNGAGGALIDVSGSRTGAVAAEDGEVIFRAARTGDGAGDGVKVDITAPAAVQGAKRVLVEAVKKYSYNTIGASQQTTIKDDTNTFATNVENLMATYSKTRDGKSAIIAPSVDVYSAGDLTVSSDWVLGNSTSTAANFIASGGVLTLRAGGNLNINGNIDSEQFRAGNLISQYANSWNYRLVAGADESSVNPEAVVNGTGNIALRDSKFIRTGTGFIHAVAGNDITLGTESGAGAAIYTEGLPEAVTTSGRMSLPNQTENEFRLLATNFTINRELYAQGGGDVNLSAGGSISGSSTKAENQTVRDWLFHAALSTNTPNSQVRWWSRYDRFTNGVGALGGGDVSIQAAGNLSSLQIAAATNGRVGGDINAAPEITNFVELGGGDINVQSAGNINQVLLHAGNGDINVDSLGNLSNTQLSLMQSDVNLSASGDVGITKISNPTLTQSAVNGATNKVTFYTYNDETAVNATSASGDINVSSEGSVAPATLFLAATKGDVTVENVTMAPSKTGNATLLAGKNLKVSSLNISDVNPELIPTIKTANIKSASAIDFSNYQGANGHTATALHLNDINPVRLYAQNDVIFKQQNPVIVPKRIEVKAGNDIVDANLVIQNLKDTDVSVLEAGNAIRYSDPDISGDEFLAIEAGIQVAGPGRLHLVAGGDVDLGTSNGILSEGNKFNPYLPEQGADVFVLPGAGAMAQDFSVMLNAYLEPTSQYSSIYLPQLTQYMQQRNGNTSLTNEQALAGFKLLDKTSQTDFISRVFFAEIKISGRNAIDTKHAEFGDYSRAERAILTMFPNSTKNQSLATQAGSIMKDFSNIREEEIQHPGDLKLFYSQIRSERGGKVDLLVPGGYVNAGLAVSGGLAKPDTDLGIVSLRGGEINAMVRNDFQVNQSRVFTLGGSDLMLYSALEDIDAGKGAKTASSTPPPVLRISNGQVTYDYSAAVSGSGIAALISTGGEPGTVDLFAPYGEINAGEAGVRSAGNINLGARVIVGADNIVAGGVTTGAPVASVSGLGVVAPLPADATGAGTQNSQLSDAAKQSAGNDNKEKSPSLISVEVVALGDESSSNDAKTSAPKSTNEEGKSKKKSNSL